MKCPRDAIIEIVNTRTRPEKTCTAAISGVKSWQPRANGRTTGNASHGRRPLPVWGKPLFSLTWDVENQKFIKLFLFFVSPKFSDFRYLPFLWVFGFFFIFRFSRHFLWPPRRELFLQMLNTYLFFAAINSINSYLFVNLLIYLLIWIRPFRWIHSANEKLKMFSLFSTVINWSQSLFSLYWHDKHIWRLRRLGAFSIIKTFGVETQEYLGFSLNSPWKNNVFGSSTFDIFRNSAVTGELEPARNFWHTTELTVNFGFPAQYENCLSVYWTNGSNNFELTSIVDSLWDKCTDNSTQFGHASSYAVATWNFIYDMFINIINIVEQTMYRLPSCVYLN